MKSFNNIKRKAFTMVELAFVIVIIGIIIAGAIRSIDSSKEDRRVFLELIFYQKIESSIKTTFIKILDSFEGPCSRITSDGTNRWGWGNAITRRTSPLPVYDATAGGRKLRYSIQWASLTVSQRNSLENTIRSNFSAICKTDPVASPINASGITLFCPKLTGLSYQTTGAFVARGHTLGSPINPQAAPTVRVSFERKTATGNVAPSIQIHDFTMVDIFQFRQNYSLNKFNRIRSALRTYHDAQLFAELQNPPASGLHSMDDEFVPWFWKAFGDNKNTVINTRCIIAGNVCTNISNNNAFRSSLSGRGLYMRRLVANLLTESRFAVDGFNNQISIFPIASQCTNSNISLCTISAPTSPRNDYITVGGITPPYSSILYLEGFTNKTLQHHHMLECIYHIKRKILWDNMEVM